MNNKAHLLPDTSPTKTKRNLHCVSADSYAVHSSGLQNKKLPTVE